MEFKGTVAGLEQKFCIVPDKVKEAHLVYFLNQVKLKSTQQVIVFTSTCRNCHFIALLLQQLGFEVGLIHS
jgi:superfamily II DNA/RNA helicase